ncbi:MAG: tRNA guanosine(34) transglycosylase Tgt [Flavobacteriaceae bacterium]|nr:tRNA guanosine(34) transglycosylase Tgt [Flavobacteriaceae bacterium]
MREKSNTIKQEKHTNSIIYDDNSSARACSILTQHGAIDTPVFMPVGTLGTVKGLSQEQLSHPVGAQIMLGNTYHLYLRPGKEILKHAGGIHQFISWSKPILTDSGGYQVYSLADRRKIDEHGVQFKSHIDGSTHVFTPENAVCIQRKIGADIMMAFDECTPYPVSHKEAQLSMDRTHRWLDRGLKKFKESTPCYGYPQVFVPIVQGSVYSDLRKSSAEFISQKNAPINAIGGLSVGEPIDLMYQMTQEVCDILPKNKPRYLMGVGTPLNILECISLGIDMFDCVMPTRNGRNGMLFTIDGVINIKNQKWKSDFSQIDTNAYSTVGSQYTKAYLRHLFSVNELLGKQIASIHNLSFYIWLTNQARKKIIDGSFVAWKNRISKNLDKRL